jgi:hypothetical protein
MMDERTTLSSVIRPSPTPLWTSSSKAQDFLATEGNAFLHTDVREVRIQRNDSTVNGVMIGLLSSFGSAILIAFIFLIVYFFKYTSSGRILLDRIGRPGEYDDEQAFSREEEAYLEEVSEGERTEYLRAKGMVTVPFPECAYERG